jgi:hypothetical protein
MGCCNFCYIKLLRFFGFRTRPTNLRTLSPGSSRMFHSITKYFLDFFLLYLIVFPMITPFLLSFLLPLTSCDQVPYTLVYIFILCLIYILITPIIHYFYLQDNRLQDTTGIRRISIICYLIFFIFIVIFPTITYNHDVVVQQGDKVYQCVSAYRLPLQAYPVVLDLNSSVIEDYRGHGYSCDLSSYGPICPYGQTLEALPNYLRYNNGSRFLDAFVCKYNDPEGVNLCRHYVSVSSDWKFVWSLICNCMSDQSRLANDEDVRVERAIGYLWNRCIWITVPKSDVTPHHEGNFTTY